MTPPSVALVGTGPVAWAIGLAQAAAAGRIVAVVSRDPGRAALLAGASGASGTVRIADALPAEVVIVAVADHAVGAVGERLRDAAAGHDVLALHTSGALPGALLDGGGVRGGSLHPLQSLPRAGGADSAARALLLERLRGTHWFHEGAGAPEAVRLVAAWGGSFHALAPGGKALYHAGAAILSNHTVALYHAAQRLFAAAGVPPAESAAPLDHLLAGTLRNLAELGPAGALTGPVARGDVQTVRGHLVELGRTAPELLGSYVALARLAVDIARRKGAAADRDLDEIERLLAAAASEGA